jgi:flavin-dependent dehydrogenase
MTSAKNSPATSPDDLQYETDIVIAGGGLSGLSAALTAAECGVKAIILEKLHVVGGAGMGILAGNSPYLDNEPAIRQFRGPDHLKQMRCALSQPFLWVNRHGDRFYNESFVTDQDN